MLIDLQLRLQNDLYCVDGDVKSYSFTRSTYSTVNTCFGTWTGYFCVQQSVICKAAPRRMHDQLNSLDVGNYKVMCTYYFLHFNTDTATTLAIAPVKCQLISFLIGSLSATSDFFIWQYLHALRKQTGTIYSTPTDPVAELVYCNCLDVWNKIK